METKMEESPEKNETKMTQKRTRRRIKKVEDNHKQWHVKPNENFSELFRKNSSHCPNTKNGIIICMKFFVKGVCNKACNPEEEKDFDTFVKKCRSLDFQQGAEETSAP